MKHKKSKITLIFLILLSITISAYSQPQITEINFNDPEFIEIFSNTTIKLISIYDSAGKEKENTLTEIKNSSSNCSLIISSTFNNYFNTNNIQCNIYSTNKDVLTYYGLNSKGEDVSITYLTNNSTNANNTETISWVKITDLIFQNNETLHLYKNNSFINNWTPGNFDIYRYINLTNNNTLSNFTNQTINNTINQCDFLNNKTFNISEDYNLFQEQLKYKFELENELSDYEFHITYWIEDFYGNIIREKRSTTNTNTKSFTPNSNFRTDKLFNIKGILNINNCTLKTNKFVIFIPETEYIVDENNEEDNNDDTNNNLIYSSIEILNINTVLQNKYIKLKVCRGDTTKQVITIKLNNKIINKLYPEKNTCIESNIYPEYYNLLNTNILKIEGLDLIKIFNFNNLNNKPIVNSNNSNSNTTTQLSNKKYLNVKILNTIINNNNKSNYKIDFSINTTYQGNLSCYILNKKTKISNIFSKHITNASFINTQFDIQKKYNNTELKLLCKIKILNKSYYKYNTTIFYFNNITISNNVSHNNHSNSKINNSKNLIQTNIFNASPIESFNNKNNYNNITKKNITISNIPKINLTKKTFTLDLKEDITKKTKTMAIGGLSLLLILMLIRF